MKAEKILLTEDDPNLSFMLTDGLEDEGFDITACNEGEKALELFKKSAYDIVLLDVNLSGRMTGFETARCIRAFSSVPVIFITSRTKIEDMQEGFSIGRVDYLKKPFGIRELVLRINEILSRTRNEQPLKSLEFSLGKFTFTPEEQSLQDSEQNIHLPKTENAALKALCENMGKVTLKKEIMEHVWGFSSDIRQKDASMNNIILALRSKLGSDSSIHLDTIPKAGWKLHIQP